MGYLNKVLIIGNICQDPEKRITPSGKPVCNLSVATTEYFKDKSGQKQEKTEFHKCQFWDRQAELVTEYCQKGSSIYLEGSLQTREWQDKDGNRRFSTEVVVRNMQFLDRKKDSQESGQQSGGYQGQGKEQYPGEHADGTTGQGQDDFIEDDIPF